MRSSTAKYGVGAVIENVALPASYYCLRLRLPEGMDLRSARPGQFVMVKGPWGIHPILPRAFSVYDAGDGWFEILGKPVGRGTRLLARLGAGDAVSVLGPLGLPFPAPAAGRRDLLCAGGVGIPPIFMQAKSAAEHGLAELTELIYGARTADELVALPRCESLGIGVHTMTDDGSAGEKGLVTDRLGPRVDELGASARVMACGPTPMLRAVADLCRKKNVDCYLALEEQMGCGVGVCRSCMVRRPEGGYLCTCLDGPVVDARQVVL